MPEKVKSSCETAASLKRKKN